MNDAWVFPFVILPLFFALLIVTRLLTTLFHELGHAIPAIIFTKENVNVFIGSYGDEEHSKCLKICKKFYIYFTVNPLKWTGGMVKHTGRNMTGFKNLIMLSLGPIFTLLLTSFALVIIFNNNLHGFFKLFIIFFFASALFDLRNLYPSRKRVLLKDGTYTYCDGYQIVRIIKYRSDEKALLQAYKLYSNEEYQKAIELFESLHDGFITSDILKIIVSSYNQVKKFKQAKDFYSKFINTSVFENLDSDVLFNIGLVESILNEIELAMEYYNRSITLNNNNSFSLSNRGYTFNLFGDYTSAIKDFDKVIQIDPNSAYVFANRAYSKLKLGLLEESLDDIKKSLSINNNEAYAYRNLGVYYIEMEDYAKATEQLNIAYELDPDTHMIEYYMQTAKEKI